MRLPDIRGWATLGMFVLVAYVVTLVAFIPSLATNELFKMLATLLIGTGGFGLVCAFLWGGSKVSANAGEAMAERFRADTERRP